MNRRQKATLLSQLLNGRTDQARHYQQRQQSLKDIRTMTDAELDAIIQQGMTDEQRRNYRPAESLSDDELETLLNATQSIQSH